MQDREIMFAIHKLTKFSNGVFQEEFIELYNLALDQLKKLEFEEFPAPEIYSYVRPYDNAKRWFKER